MIVWAEPGRTSRHICPVCDKSGPHEIVLTVPDGVRTHVLLRCGVCTAHFYEDRTPPSYADDPSDDYTAYYAEQGADVWGMTETLSRLRVHRPGSLLDVGCGFGFTVDMAVRRFGWRAVGVDPCGLAQDGARLLGAPIINRYLERDSDFGDPFDVIQSSEVIEHVDDPYGFIDTLRAHLAPGGVLVLKTPNAEALVPDAAPGMMSAILAPGSHLILYTALSIKRALRKAGFTHIVVEANGSSLAAFASDEPIDLRPADDGAHARHYALYLEDLMRSAPKGGPVWNGAAARLFRLRVFGGEPIAALRVYDELAEVYAASFEIDLLRPQRIATPSPAGPGARYRVPYNLPSVIYTRAVLARLLPAQDPLTILAFLRVAERLAVAVGGGLQARMLFDGDLENTALLARCEAVDALWPIDRDASVDVLAALGKATGSPFDGHMVVPAALRLPKVAGCFIRLAVRLADLFEDLDVVERVLALDGTLLHLVFCTAILELNVFGRREHALNRLHRLRRLAARVERDEPKHAEQARHMLSLADEHIAKIAEMAPATHPG